jgi:hypothetical protein
MCNTSPLILEGRRVVLGAWANPGHQFLHLIIALKQNLNRANERKEEEHQPGPNDEENS